MAQAYPDEGGFLVKFNEKDAFRCFAIDFDYDNWEYSKNANEKKPIPEDVKTITIVVEHPE
ncbi:MAG: hypothetical protein ABIH85_03680 [Candidatus Omnitrophota bacterium]